MWGGCLGGGGGEGGGGGGGGGGVGLGWLAGLAGLGEELDFDFKCTLNVMFQKYVTCTLHVKCRLNVR